MIDYSQNTDEELHELLGKKYFDYKKSANIQIQLLEEIVKLRTSIEEINNELTNRQNKIPKSQ